MTARGVILPHHLAQHAADVLGQEHCLSCQEVVRAITTAMAEGRQQFWVGQGGPRDGVASGLPATMPMALTGYDGGHYVATGDTNEKGQHVYEWEPTA